MDTELLKTNLLIGTSGYDYPEWKGVFYPQDLPRKDFLAYYSTQFNAVELNFSFYRMPAPEQMQNMLTKSEEKIFFSVKAHQSFTHLIERNWRDGAKEFKGALEPLLDKGKLSSVLFQFPQSFHYTRENRIYLSELIGEFEGVPAAVEFRQAKWIKESVALGLMERKADMVFCDEPCLKGIPSPFGEENKRLLEKSGAVYLRFHGRNAASWYCNDKANPSARYEYLYSDNEIKEYVPVIHNKIETGKKVQAYFNNHPKGAAGKNALKLKELARRAGEPQAVQRAE